MTLSKFKKYALRVCFSTYFLIIGYYFIILSGVYSSKPFSSKTAYGLVSSVQERGTIFMTTEVQVDLCCLKSCTDTKMFIVQDLLVTEQVKLALETRQQVEITYENPRWAAIFSRDLDDFPVIIAVR